MPGEGLQLPEVPPPGSGGAQEREGARRDARGPVRPRYQADGNQADIVGALRAVGCSVQIIEGANGTRGVPDLLVGRGGRNYLLEVKRPKSKGRRAGALSEEQRYWHLVWGGQSAVVENVAAAFTAIGIPL